MMFDEDAVQNVDQLLHCRHSRRAIVRFRAIQSTCWLHWLLCAILVTPYAAAAADFAAGPRTYRDVVRKLKAGDTLQLAPGIYRLGLDIHDLVGAPGAPISIRGRTGTARSVFVASGTRNTVSIVDSAYVQIINLDLTGIGVAVDGVKAEGKSHYAHHITLEGLHIDGYDANQQNVAISTKCPTWNWIIRNNVIVGAGTGMYLGDSDGSAPFVRGVIEGNVVRGTLGYSIQIKHQNHWSELPNYVDDHGATIIRYNTLVKDARSSAGGLARPNLLLGHWPLVGRGSGDRYLVYGNLLVDNPHEFLMQAEGNVTVYNNVFLNRFGDAIAIREHNDVPRWVDVFHNTIIARGVGMLLRNGDPSSTQTVSSNAIFAQQVVPSSLMATNLVRSFEDAGGSPPDRAPDLPEDAHWNAMNRTGLPDVQFDFDRIPRNHPTYGALAGEHPVDYRRLRELRQ